MGALFALLLSAPTSAATLQEAWSAAEANSREIVLIEAQQEATETLPRQAWALVQPKVVAQGSYNINEYEIAIDFAEGLQDMIPPQFAELLGDVESEPIVVQKKEFLTGNVSVIQPLFSGEALPLLQGAYNTVKAGDAQTRAARAQVKIGVAQVYYGVVVAREGVALAEDALANAKKHQELARVRVAAGTAPPNTTLQAELSVARAEREVAKAKEGLANAERTFSRLTGLPLGTPVQLPEGLTLPYGTLDEALARVSSRPSIDAARYQSLAASNQVTANHLSWLPDVDGRFTYNYTENTGFSDDKTMWILVFSANWTLWDGGARLAQGQQAATQARMAVVALEKATAEGQDEIRQYWAERDRAATALTAVEKELALSQDNLRLAEAAYAAGTLSFLEVEDARLGVAATKLSMLQERMSRDLSTIQLLASTGDLD